MLFDFMKKLNNIFFMNIELEPFEIIRLLNLSIEEKDKSSLCIVEKLLLNEDIITCIFRENGNFLEKLIKKYPISFSKAFDTEQGYWWLLKLFDSSNHPANNCLVGYGQVLDWFENDLSLMPKHEYLVRNNFTKKDYKEIRDIFVKHCVRMMKEYPAIFKCYFTKKIYTKEPAFRDKQILLSERYLNVFSETSDFFMNKEYIDIFDINKKDCVLFDLLNLDKSILSYIVRTENFEKILNEDNGDFTKKIINSFNSLEQMGNMAIVLSKLNKYLIKLPQECKYLLEKTKDLFKKYFLFKKEDIEYCDLFLTEILKINKSIICVDTNKIFDEIIKYIILAKPEISPIASKIQLNVLLNEKDKIENKTKI